MYGHHDPAGRFPRAARALAPVILLALVGVACASARGGDEGSSSASSPYHERPVTVSVENQSWNTIHVYVLAGGQSRSLGQLSSQNTATYEVPPSIMGSREEIRLVADPIGSREGFISDRILVRPGDSVSWTLAQPLIHSHIMVN